MSKRSFDTRSKEHEIKEGNARTACRGAPNALPTRSPRSLARTSRRPRLGSSPVHGRSRSSRAMAGIDVLAAAFGRVGRFAAGADRANATRARSRGPAGLDPWHRIPWRVHSGFGRFARWPDEVRSTSRRRSAKGHNRGADTHARLCLRQGAECCEGREAIEAGRSGLGSQM
jgi:hypothetical protein